MLEEETPVVARWDAPRWANDRTVDEGAIEHSRNIGEIGPLDHEAPLVVDLVRRDELNLTAEPAFINRGQVQVRLEGKRITMEQARQLRELLTTALEAEAESMLRGSND